MDEFESIAEQVVVHKIRATWLEMSRMLIRLPVFMIQALQLD